MCLFKSRMLARFLWQNLSICVWIASTECMTNPKLHKSRQMRDWIFSIDFQLFTMLNTHLSGNHFSPKKISYILLGFKNKQSTYFGKKSNFLYVCHFCQIKVLMDIGTRSAIQIFRIFRVCIFPQPIVNVQIRVIQWWNGNFDTFQNWHKWKSCD